MSLMKMLRLVAVLTICFSANGVPNSCISLFDLLVYDKLPNLPMCKSYVGLDQNATLKTNSKYLEESPKLWESGRSWYGKSHPKKHPRILDNRTGGSDYNTIRSFDKAKTRALYHPHKSRGEMDAFEDKLSKQLKLDIFRILNSNEKRSNHTGIIDSLLGNKSEEFLDLKHHAGHGGLAKDNKNPEMYDLLTLVEDYLNSSGLKMSSDNDVAYKINFKKEISPDFYPKLENPTDYSTQNIQNLLAKPYHDLESDIRMLNVSSDEKLNEFVKKMADHISMKLIDKNSSLKSHDIKTRSENSIGDSRSYPTNHHYSVSGRLPSRAPLRHTIWTFWYRILKHNKKRGSYQTLLHQQNKILKIIKDVFFAGYKEIGDFSYDKFYLIRFALLNKYSFANISLMVPFSLKENYRKITIKILSKIYTLYDPSEILCISSAKEFVDDYKKRPHMREDNEEFDSLLRSVLKGTKYDNFDMNLGKIIFVISETEAMHHYKRELIDQSSLENLPSVPVVAGKAKSKNYEKTFDLKNYDNGITRLKPLVKHKGERDNRINKPLFRQKLRLHFQKIFNPHHNKSSARTFDNIDKSEGTSRTFLRSSLDDSQPKISSKNSFSKLSTTLSNKSFSATSEWQNTDFNIKEPNSSLYLLEQLPELPNLPSVRKPSLPVADPTLLERLEEASPSPSSFKFQKESTNDLGNKNLYFICFVPHSKKYIRKFFLPVSAKSNKSSMAKRIINALNNIYNSSEDIYLAPINEFLNSYKVKLTSKQKYNNIKTLEKILDKPDRETVFPEILFVSPLSEYRKRFNQFVEEVNQKNTSSSAEAENYEKLVDGEIPLGSKIVSFLRNNHNDSLPNTYRDPRFNAWSILQDIGKISTLPSVVSAWKDYTKFQKSKLDNLKKILADQINTSRTTLNPLPVDKLGSIHFDLEQIRDRHNLSEIILVALKQGNDTKYPFPIVVEKNRPSIPRRALNESRGDTISKLVFPMLTANNIKKNLSKTFSENLFLAQDPSIVETAVNNTKFVVVSRDKAMARIFNSILLKMFSKEEKKRRERTPQHYYYLVRPLSRDSSNISQKVPFSDNNFVRELFTYIYRIYSQTEVVYIVPAHDVIKDNDPKNLLKRLLNFPKALPNLTNIIFIASAGEILDNYKVSPNFGEASLLLKSLPDLESLPSTPYIDNINFYPLKPGGIFYPGHNHSKSKDGEYKYLVKTLKRIKNVRHKGNKTQDVYIVVKKNCTDPEKKEHEEPIKPVSHPLVKASKDVKFIAKELNNLFKNVIVPKPFRENSTTKVPLKVYSKSRSELNHGNSTVSIHFEPIFVYYGDNKIRSYEMEKLKMLLGKNIDGSSQYPNYTNFQKNSMLQKELKTVNSVLMEVKRDISASTNRSENRNVDRKMSYTDINYGSGDSALEKSESETDHFEIEKPKPPPVPPVEKTEEEMLKYTDIFKTTEPTYEEPTFEQIEPQMENSDDPQYEASNSEKYNPADNRSKQVIEKFMDSKNTDSGLTQNSITNDDENYDDNTHLGPFDGLSNRYADQTLGDTIESEKSIVSQDLRSLDKEYEDGEEEDFSKDLRNFGSKKIKHAKAVIGFKTPMKMKFLTKALDDVNTESKSDSKIMLKSYSISSEKSNITNKKSDKSNRCKYHERNGMASYNKKRGRYITNDIDTYEDCYSPVKGKRDTETAEDEIKEMISTTEKSKRNIPQFFKMNFLGARQNVTQSWFRKLFDYHSRKLSMDFHELRGKHTRNPKDEADDNSTLVTTHEQSN